MTRPCNSLTTIEAKKSSVISEMFLVVLFLKVNCHSRKKAKLGLTGHLFSGQPHPQNTVPCFSPEEYHTLFSPLSWTCKQFHESDESTTAINLGTYTRTEVKRANANANASPTNDESAESTEAGGAMRPLTRKKC